MFKDWNYSVFRIGKGEDLVLHALDSIGIHGIVDDSDYLLCPTEQKDSILQLF